MAAGAFVGGTQTCGGRPSTAAPTATPRLAATPLQTSRHELQHRLFASAGCSTIQAAQLCLQRQPLRQLCCSAAMLEEAPPAAEEAEGLNGFTARPDIRNIAIIAHIDHGKTTLVDAMLKQAKVFRANQAVETRIMDSGDIERERGITILSKNTAVRYKGVKLNIIDTPGHADFGGEVERVLNMCDGVLLLVDAVEGPMPQTRFVLRKALALDKKVVVVVNKIDRPAARPDWVIDATFELFMELGASDAQCEFPVVFASGVNGTSGNSPAEMAEDLEPLFECVVREVAPPWVRLQAPTQMLVTNLDYDEHKGRIAIGRLTSGTIAKAQNVAFCKPGDAKPKTGRVNELYVYDNFSRVTVEEVGAGDICAMTGLAEVSIGDTICDPNHIDALPTIEVEQPTVRMTFAVNTSPFAGREGKFVTSRNLKERLERELEKNLALRVEPGDSADEFIVSGRGALHISILMENMRREGYEFAVGPPKVITKKDEAGKTLEPYEEAMVEVPEVHLGQVVDLLGQRKGQMVDMASDGADAVCRVKYNIPTRGLLGIRSTMLTATKGTAVLNTNFLEYGPWCGDISTRELGSLIAYETGQATSYALESVQQRGKMMIQPGDEIYEGQVIGIHQRNGDLKVNACKKKAANNIRSATKEATVVLNEATRPNLDEALEYVIDDELVEVTPTSIRVRKNPKSKSKAAGGGKK